MNFFLILLISAIIIIAFFSGVVIEHYQILQFEELKFYLNPLMEPQIIKTSEIHNDDEDKILERISIHSEQDLIQKRSEMIDYIWMGSGFPTADPRIEYNVKVNDFDDLTNLQKIDKFTVGMDFGKNANKFLKSTESEMISISYLFHAKNPKKTLIVYHQGHGEQSILDDKKIVEFFLGDGYSVLMFSMPAREENNEPIVDTYRFGKLKLSTHNHFQLVDNEFFHPIKFFLEPIAVTLNHIEENYDYQSVHMIGLSGGGWTTVVYSALDPRISQSYSIAGAFPMYMRDKNTLGDYEQTIPNFYEIVNYEELFVMDAYGHGRKALQIFNYNDPCCFQAETYEKSPYESAINKKLIEIGSGEFKVILDKSANGHIISDFTLEVILSEIENYS